MTGLKFWYWIILHCIVPVMAYAQNIGELVDTIPYPTYPLVIDSNPHLPSPFTTQQSQEYVIAVTNEKKHAIIQVTLRNDYDICSQLIVDTLDFPELALSGLHSEERLNKIKTITGRSLEAITELGRPNRLSQAGFLSTNEDVLSVIKGDNKIVKQLGLTHPQLAKPIFHVLNMMDTDLRLNRWNMAKHKWENIKHFYYNNRTVLVEAEDTKGGQESIFNDSIGGSFYIKLWRILDKQEKQYLENHYGHLSKNEFDDLVDLLSSFHTGEMQPQYIMRYGFYEGHTYWRTDPITISFIFGLKSLYEIDQIFNHKLNEILTRYHTESL